MRVVAWALAGLLFAVPLAAGQGPPLDVETNTIWNQYTNSPSCCTTFGSTLNEDPRFSGSGNYGTLTLLPAGTSTSFVLRYELTPQEFAYPLLLDPEGTVDFTVHLGGGVSTAGAVGVANVDVDVSLTLGDTVVASGTGESVLDHAGDGYKQVTYSVAPEVTRLDPAEGPLAWTMTLTGAANGVYVSHTDANGNGFVVLPIIGIEGGGANQTLYVDLETPSVEHVFANATSDTYVFNFTANQTHGILDLQVNGTGMANVTLTDASGAELLNATAATEILELTNATAGPWQLTVGYQNFTGNLSFAYRDGASLAPPSAPQVDDETGNGTGNNTLDDAPDDQESPGPSLLPLAVLLVAIALRRRT